MPMNKRILAWTLLGAALLVGSGAYFARGHLASNGSGQGPPGDTSKDDRDDSIPVAVETAVQGPISHRLTATANLRAQREVEVATRAAGIVTAVRAEEGDFVKAGQILCSLDDTELQIDLQLAEQRLAQTRIQLEAAGIRKEQTSTKLANKRTELARNEHALQEGLLAESEVAVERHEIEDLAHEVRVVESTVRENHHRIDELESEIEKAKLLIAQTSIRAPFAGRVTERNVETGQSVRVADKLYKIGSFVPLYADVFVPERDSTHVRPGQPVEIALGGDLGAAASGLVDRVSPVVDEQTGTVKVTARFDNVGREFRPGAFVRVEVETDTRPSAVLIPRQAIIEEGGQMYVVLIGEGGVAQRAEVELGYQESETVEVLRGVGAGDKVVVAGQGKLKDGDKARVVAN